MTRFLLACCAAVALLSSASAKAAAQDSVPVLVRVLVRRLDRLAATPDIQRLRPGVTGMALLGQTRLAEFGRLDDSTLVAQYGVIRRLLERADEQTCGAAWVPGQGVTGPGFIRLAATADSALAVEWSEVIARLASAAAHGRRSGGERAAPDEARRLITAARERLPAADQARVAALTTGAPLSAEDRCAALRAIYRGYGLLPRARAAAVLRTVTGP